MADKQIFANTGVHSAEVQTNTFDKSFNNNMTGRFGLMYPCFVEEAPTKSHYDIDMSFAFEADPIVFPLQSPVRQHIQLYKVPIRILYKYFKRMYANIGHDGTINGHEPYVMPFIKRSNWCKQGSLADYMGLPTNRIDQSEGSIGITSPSPNLPVCEHYYYENGSIVNRSDIRDKGLLLHIPKGNLLRTDTIHNTGTIFAYFYTEQNIDVTQLQALIDRDISDFKVVGCSTEAVITHGRLNFFQGLWNGIMNIFGVSDPNWRFQVADHPNARYDTEQMPVSSVTIGAKVAKTYQDRTYYCVPVYFTLSSEFIASYNELSVNHNMNLLLNISESLFTYLASTPWPWAMLGFSAVGDDDKEFSQATSATIKPLQPQGGLTQVYANVHNYLSTDGFTSPFESVNGADPIYPINALPFRAYEFIYRYFFANTRVTPFVKNGIPVYDEFITNDGEGADTTEYDFFHAPYEYDMFTTCVPTPFFGNAPLVGITTNSSTSSSIEMQDGEGTRFSIDVAHDQDGVLTAVHTSFSPNDPKTAKIDALQQAIQFGISIADISNANALTRMQFKQNQAGTKFPNLLEEFYGVHPNLGEEYPEYCGGITRQFDVNKITNVAQSEGNPLGDFAANGSVNGRSEHIRIFCNEPCYIIGITYWSVTPVYPQSIAPHFLKNQILDYHNPLFNNTTPQPVPKKWLTPLQLTDGHFEDVFGYNRPYVDYVTRFDEVHGDFRGNRMNFLLQRLFAVPPELSKRFLEIHSEDLTDIFVDTSDTDKFYGMIHFDVKATLPIPRFYFPALL